MLWQQPHQKVILFSIILLQITFHFCFSAELLLIGRVRHANTLQDIPNVNIFVENSSFGTSSAINGNFRLIIPDTLSGLHLIFQHISYDTLAILVGDALDQQEYHLVPRIIQASPITIQAQREHLKIHQDLPQPLAVIAADNFDIHGYVDAGDLLRNEQSVQIEEELSGKKTIALRAGNSDDVIILYNGIKMNSAYDNVFDLSLINLEDVQHFEVIRGSNTSLFGPEAFSGVINIVPKIYKNYRIRFQQRIGTYASGDWSLQLNQTYKDKLTASYSYKQGRSKREYIEEDDHLGQFLNNKITNHSASLMYDLTHQQDQAEKNLSFLYLRSTLDHENDKYDENLTNLNQMLSFRYQGNIWRINQIALTGAYQSLDRNQQVTVERGIINQKFENRNLNFNTEKNFSIKNFEWYLSYQFEAVKLDYQDKRALSQERAMGIESAIFSRKKQGLASIFKYYIPTHSDFLKIAEVDLSYRYDHVKNTLEDVVERKVPRPDFVQSTHTQPEDKAWSESTYKFSTQLLGENRFFRMNTYLNFGSNVKFPTLFQQLSSPLSLGPSSQSTRPNLNPEKNRSLEFGLNLLKEINEQGTLNGWQLDFNYFQNYYDNKFRIYYSPGIPMAFFDNVQNADIFGLEILAKLFMVKKKVQYELGISKFFISERAAFPFKSDLKFIMNLFFDHAGYSFQVHAFHESEQVAWIRNSRGEFWEVFLAGYSNLDLHLNKHIEVKRFKFFVNLSARNLLDDHTLLEGIAIRDRRFYITFGAQY